MTQRIKLTKENIIEYIDANIVYRSSTPGGWAMVVAIHDTATWTTGIG